jgi:hypothetical protein
MTPWQRTALRHTCRLAGECVNPRFLHLVRRSNASIVLTVNSGYE